MPWRTVLPLAVVCGALGVLFGAAEVTTVAFADEHGHKGWSGGCSRCGRSAACSPGWSPARSPGGAARRSASGSARSAWPCAMAPLRSSARSRVMGVFLLIGGVRSRPTMIATMSLTQEAVPPARLTEGMAIMQTGIVAGVAPGPR